MIEKEPTRDHTERMLRGFGASVRTEQTAEGRVITLRGQPELAAQTIAVPRDPSSAAFPVAAALIVEGSELTLPGIGLNPTRAGLYITLQEMGADIALENRREEGGEPAADLRVRFGALRGIEVPPERAASMIDEYPILAALAASAEGMTTMRGIRELRVKESDRIDAMARGLEACGVKIEEGEDYLIVHGRGPGGVDRRRDGGEPPRPPHRHVLPLPRPRRARADRRRRRRARSPPASRASSSSCAASARSSA